MSGSNRKYAVMSEVHGELDHTFLYFLLWDGNEKNLKKLLEDIEMVDEMCIYDDDSMFFLDLENLVCETTAREMCLLSNGDGYFHRKFDGVLRPIDFKFSKRDDDEDYLMKINGLLYEGGISEYIGSEDHMGREIVDRKEHTVQKEPNYGSDDEIKELREKLDKLEKRHK